MTKLEMLQTKREDNDVDFLVDVDPGWMEEIYNWEDLKTLGSLYKTAEETLPAFSFMIVQWP